MILVGMLAAFVYITYLEAGLQPAVILALVCIFIGVL